MNPMKRSSRSSLKSMQEFGRQSYEIVTGRKSEGNNRSILESVLQCSVK